jgi:hypothetical protein
VPLLVDSDTREQLEGNQELLKTVVVGGVIIESFDDIFAVSEVEDAEKGTAKQEGTAEDAREQFDAVVEPGSVVEMENGGVRGKDKRNGKTIIFRERSTDPRADATLEEQRVTEGGRVRKRKVRFIRQAEPIDPTSP